MPAKMRSTRKGFEENGNERSSGNKLSRVDKIHNSDKISKKCRKGVMITAKPKYDH